MGDYTIEAEIADALSTAHYWRIANIMGEMVNKIQDLEQRLAELEKDKSNG